MNKARETQQGPKLLPHSAAELSQGWDHSGIWISSFTGKAAAVILYFPSSYTCFDFFLILHKLRLQFSAILTSKNSANTSPFQHPMVYFEFLNTR